MKKYLKNDEKCSKNAEKYQEMSENVEKRWSMSRNNTLHWPENVAAVFGGANFGYWVNFGKIY